MACYLFGSFAQTSLDNVPTSARQMQQQFSRDANGNFVDPKVANAQMRQVFYKHPIAASFSGLPARLVGVGIKRIPKFGFLLGYSYVMGENGEIGLGAATFASIFSAPIINCPRYCEKQARLRLKETGKSVGMLEIIRESRKENFRPLFRGTIPLMGHSFMSASLGLCGQPLLQKKIAAKLGSDTKLGESATNLIASTLVSPVYVLATTPISILETTMQTAAIRGKPISTLDAIKILGQDTSKFGMRAPFRGGAMGLLKAVMSLNLFHEFRLIATNYTKRRNERLGLVPN